MKDWVQPLAPKIRQKKRKKKGFEAGKERLQKGMARGSSGNI